MKTIYSFLMTLALIPILTSSSGMAVDSDGHTLTELWKDYYTSRKADKPQDQLKALEAIKKEAGRRRLTWDFYDACYKFADVKTDINWKDREESLNAFRREILEYGDPVAVFYMKRGDGDKELEEYILKHEKALRKGQNPEFYTRDYRISRHRFSKALTELFRNDWDYVLWSLFPSEEKMLSEYKDYPLRALVEYSILADMPQSEARDADTTEARLRQYAKEYEGRAVALLARDHLLSKRFNSLNRNETSTSRDFEDLRDDCKALVRDRSRFSGNEGKIASCCTWSDSILNQLDSRNISFRITDGAIDVELRNVGKFDVQIFDGKKKIWEKHLDNPARSFYKADHIRFDLPSLDDGEYLVKCLDGKLESEGDYYKYSISAAIRWNADGPGIWAADYLTGEPLKKVDVEVMKDGKTVKTLKDFALDGFTTLPEGTALLLGDKKLSYNLRLKFREGQHNRASKLLFPGHYYAPDLLDIPGERHGVILTDRSAFNPDETVHFKAIVYYGRYTMRTAGAGEAYDAVLRNPKGEEIGRMSLSTNENGSVSGDFILKRGERNGNYRIELVRGNQTIATKSLRVDDFVLPSFDLGWEEIPELYFPLEKVHVRGSIRAYSGHSLDGADMTYTVSHDGQTWKSGRLTLENGSDFCIEFPTDSTREESWYDWYELSVKVVDVSGETAEFQKGVSIRRRSSKADEPSEFYFKDGEGINVKTVAGQKPVWAVVELYGTGGILLDRRLEHFAPRAGQNASLELDYPYLDSYPSGVSLNILYFQDKHVYRHSLTRSRRNTAYDLPLSFERFLDTTSPGAKYSFTIQTGPGAECAVTIFDKSTERYMSNKWNKIAVSEYPLPYINYNTECGSNDSQERYRPIFYGRALGAKTRSVDYAMEMSAMDSAENVEIAEEQASAEQKAVKQESDSGEDIPIREDFATTIAWEPFVKADGNGVARYSFTNADKLSTYYVQVFAHDADMKNSALRKEMKVTIPVKISLAEPKFLYEGDRYEVRIGLASTLDKAIEGSLTATFIEGADHLGGKLLKEERKTVSVPAGGSIFEQSSIMTPDGVDTLGIKLVFKPASGSEGADGVFVAVPVRKAEQTLKESHSAVLLDGADAAALEKELRAAFVNIPGSKADLVEISILDMIKEAIPKEVQARSDNAIALSQALYARHLCTALGQSISFDRDGTLEKLLACRNSDGGFAWFKDMQSSAIVTAIVLQRLHGLGLVDEEAAVKFIDRQYFNKDSKRWWFCGLSLSQYLYTRSLFPDVEFTEKTDRDFRKEVNAYLVPHKERGLNARIFAKARRLLTLENLLSKEGGTTLARKLGIKLGAGKKMRRSLNADVESLVQYAVPHKSGGSYYPNAVMPWRGLLEGELYAHTLLCKLLERHGHGDISNGIRLWMMLQKETQHWESDPGYIEAIAAVLEGPESVLNTRVMALSGIYTKAFEAIKATGNGMSIELDTRMPDTLKVGDRVKITYNITSEENRSFVRITLPHNAGLVPVNQISGYRWGHYRSVMADRSELWYESYPEEKTTVTEEYYVTRAGVFQSPAALIESLYAPHYSANTACPEPQPIK